MFKCRESANTFSGESRHFVSYRKTHGAENEHHKKLTHRHRAAINPHGRGSRMVFLNQTSTGQQSLYCDTPWHYTIRKLKGKQKNSSNYTQTLHFALYSVDFPRVAKCIVCAPNYTQTLHKLYTATLH